MVYSNTAVDVGNEYDKFGHLYNIFTSLEHLMMLLKSKIFRASLLHNNYRRHWWLVMLVGPCSSYHYWKEWILLNNAFNTFIVFICYLTRAAHVLRGEELVRGTLYRRGVHGVCSPGGRHQVLQVSMLQLSLFLVVDGVTIDVFV